MSGGEPLAAPTHAHSNMNKREAHEPPPPLSLHLSASVRDVHTGADQRRCARFHTVGTLISSSPSNPAQLMPFGFIIGHFSGRPLRFCFQPTVTCFCHGICCSQVECKHHRRIFLWPSTLCGSDSGTPSRRSFSSFFIVAARGTELQMNVGFYRILVQLTCFNIPIGRISQASCNVSPMIGCFLLPQ